MGEILGAVLLSAIVIMLAGLYQYYRSKKKDEERSAYTYNEIATKWYLWDAVVNCYYIDSEGNSVAPLKPMKAPYMDYETFFGYSTEEKLRMLEQDFGVEQIKTH